MLTATWIDDVAINVISKDCHGARSTEGLGGDTLGLTAVLSVMLIIFWVMFFHRPIGVMKRGRGGVMGIGFLTHIHCTPEEVSIGTYKWVLRGFVVDIFDSHPVLL